MLIFLSLIITIYKVKTMPALPSTFVTPLVYGLSLLLTIPGKHNFQCSQ